MVKVGLVGLAAALWVALVGGIGVAVAKETRADADRRCAAQMRACAGPVSLRCLKTKEAGQVGQLCSEAAQSLRLCLGDVMRACRDGAEIEASNRRPLVGRLFAGVDTDGRKVRYCFAEDGVVDYETPTGHWRTGVWTRVGPWAVVSMNDGYTIYLADLDASGDALIGMAVNRAGNDWRFALPEEFTPPPDSPSAKACRPGLAS